MILEYFIEPSSQRYKDKNVKNKEIKNIKMFRKDTNKLGLQMCCSGSKLKQMGRRNLPQTYCTNTLFIILEFNMQSNINKHFHTTNVIYFEMILLYISKLCQMQLMYS